MNLKYNKLLVGLAILATILSIACSKEKGEAEDSTTTPTTPSVAALKIDGKYLKTGSSEVVNLHGFVQTYSPFFNENAWSGYDIGACLKYNQQMIDGIFEAGWEVNFVRMHLDPYWSDTPGCDPGRWEGHLCFNETRFRRYLDELFVPMMKYAIESGLYVPLFSISPKYVYIRFQ